MECARISSAHKPLPSLPVSSFLSTHCPDFVLHHEKNDKPTGKTHPLREVEEADRVKFSPVGGLTASSTHFLADCVCLWKVPSLNSPGDAHGWRDHPNSTCHSPRNWTGKFCSEVRSAGDLSPKRGCLHGWCYLCWDVAQNTLLTTLLCNLTARIRASDGRQVGVHEACHRVWTKQLWPQEAVHCGTLASPLRRETS